MVNSEELSDMHVSELYLHVIDGDSDAITEMINRQQSGRALRFYPEGREDVDDDGFVTVQVTSRQGIVSIRSGRPSRSIRIDKETAIEWIISFPKLVGYCENWMREKGLTKEEKDIFLQMKCTARFRHAIYYNDDPDDPLEVEFLPYGMPEWNLSPLKCASMIHSIAVAAADKGWDYEGEATAEERAAILHLLSMPFDE